MSTQTIASTYTFSVEGHGFVAVRAVSRYAAWRRIENKYRGRHATFVKVGTW